MERHIQKNWVIIDDLTYISSYNSMWSMMWFILLRRVYWQANKHPQNTTLVYQKLRCLTNKCCIWSIKLSQSVNLNGRLTEQVYFKKLRRITCLVFNKHLYSAQVPDAASFCGGWMRNRPRLVACIRGLHPRSSRHFAQQNSEPVSQTLPFSYHRHMTAATT
jgi:hypothetical protein